MSHQLRCYVPPRMEKPNYRNVICKLRIERRRFRQMRSMFLSNIDGKRKPRKRNGAEDRGTWGWGISCFARDVTREIGPRVGDVDVLFGPHIRRCRVGTGGTDRIHYH